MPGEKIGQRASPPAEVGERAKRDGSPFREWFNKAAKATSHYVGSPWAFLLATATVVVWAATGPAFHYSETWQLVINTGTTIVTFLMVFLIQSSQNRDAKAIHLKLDELVRALDQASNKFVDAQNLQDDELEKLEKTFDEVRKKAEEIKDDAKKEEREVKRKENSL